ncbi:MAG TPA: M15 family metallopeptidase [Acidimicrobiales bacterium]
MRDPVVKPWIVSVVTLVIVVAAGIGLWMTWDSTDTSASNPLETTQPSDGGGDGDGTTTATTGDEATSTTAGDDLAAAPAAIECSTGDEPVTTDPLTRWATVVVDTEHRLPSNFEPPDLVDIATAGFPSTGDTIRRVAVSDLAALRQGAEANGTPISVVSAYRSYRYQQDLFNARVAEAGLAEATARTARPGHSEHQLGTAVDVIDLGRAELTPEFARTAAGRWVARHAYEYGFVLSYPEGMRDRTCYDFEPWHLRYVGREFAGAIRQSSLTPREWMLSHARSQG